MRDKTKISLGIVITILIYSISILISKVVKIPIEFIPSSFLTHLTMLIFSGILILYFKSKEVLKFRIKGIKINLMFRAILAAIIIFISVNIISAIVYRICNIDIKSDSNPFLKINPLQYFLFVSIFAGLSEEFLFRGFLLNMLEPLKTKFVRILKLEISISVITSGVLFGFAHLILLASGASIPFVVRIFFFTTIVGIMNGYFQEKYENNTLVAIIAHITVNTLGFLILILALNK
jgi:membrane protease YdiL (CAAX protease family)